MSGNKIGPLHFFSLATCPYVCIDNDLVCVKPKCEMKLFLKKTSEYFDCCNLKSSKGHFGFLSKKKFLNDRICRM